MSPVLLCRFFEAQIVPEWRTLSWKKCLGKKIVSEFLDSFRISWKDEVFQNVLKDPPDVFDVFFHCVFLHFCERRSGHQCFILPGIAHASGLPQNGARCLGKEQPQVCRPESCPVVPSHCPQVTCSLACPGYRGEKMKNPGHFLRD